MEWWNEEGKGIKLMKNKMKRVRGRSEGREYWRDE